MQKRFRKRVTFYAKEFVKDITAYEIINPQAEKFFVTRGINRYNLELLIKDKPDWGLIVIKIFHPFDIRLIDFFRVHEQQITKLIFVEMNYEGQMERFIRREC
jgi:pyruvate/2-oxoacid:ferredoxin oxidoreductase alpha subunit